VLLACALATGASAQTTASRPRREPPQTMMLTLSFAGAGAGDSEGMAPEVAALSGVHADSDAMLTYQRQVRRATLGVSGRTVMRYDARAGAVTPMRYQGTVGFSMGGAQRQLRASQTIGYSPFFQFGAVPEPAPSALEETALAHGDFANAGLAAYTSTTDVAMNQAISRRSSLSLSYNLHRTTFGRSDLDQTSLVGAVSLSHRLTRYISLRTGYGLRSASYPNSATEAVRVHALDLGLDYSRALSISRRTTLNFSSGSVATKLDQGMAFVMTGDATLTRMIGRTWNARLALKRDVHLLEGFAQPVLANSLSTSIGGALNRRLSVASSIGMSSGTVGIVSATAKNNYWNWTAGAGLRVTVTRRSALEAQYFYYGHRFDQDVRLAPGLANQQKRQGVRVGMTWQTPVLH
jgi:opacity protein-like surface antigen